MSRKLGTTDIDFLGVKVLFLIFILSKISVRVCFQSAPYQSACRKKITRFAFCT